MSKNKTPQSWAQWSLLLGTISVAAVLLVVPLVFIFFTALSGGLDLLWANLQEDYLQHALGLTLFVAVITVALNTLLGILFVWCVAHSLVSGRRLLFTFVVL